MKTLADLLKKGFKPCSATHPDKPNYSGHSRGRKLHIAKNDKETFCKMLVDSIDNNYTHTSLSLNGVCKNCVKIATSKKRS